MNDFTNEDRRSDNAPQGESVDRALGYVFELGRLLEKATLPLQELIDRVAGLTARVSENALGVRIILDTCVAETIDWQGVATVEHHAILASDEEVGSVEVEYEDDSRLDATEFALSSYVAERLGQHFGRMKSERNLEIERERLAHVISATNAGVWEWDIESDELTISERFSEIIGYSADELVPLTARSWMRMVHRDDLSEIEQALEEHHSGRSDHVAVDFRVRHREGRWTWVVCRGRVVEWTEQVKPKRMFGTTVDISERKRIEHALRDSSRYNEQIIRSVLEGVAVTDRTLQYRLWNPYLAELTGISSSDALGYTPREVLAAFDVEGVTARRYERALAGESSQAKEVRFEFPQTGKRGWVLETISPLYDADDEIVGVITTVQDITRRKEIEIQKNEVERIVRHDIRGQLTSIVNVPEILADAPNLTEDQRELLDLARFGGYTILNLIDNSLNLYKIETGMYQPNPVRINVASILRRCIGQAQLESRGRSVKVLATVGDRPLDEDLILYAVGEEALTHATLANLLTNAVHASNRGDTVCVRILPGTTKSQPTSTGGPAPLSIEIHNTQAIPEAIRDTFFSKYVTHGKRGGTGLGTYSSKLMIEAQGGTIDYHSDEEAGTTVTISLPTT